jgi:release factor glutamine methyltransferase
MRSDLHHGPAPVSASADRPAVPDRLAHPGRPDRAAGATSAEVVGAAVPGGPGSEPTWRELMVEARTRLQAAGGHSPDQQARWLVEQAGGMSAAELQLALDRPATAAAAAILHEMVDRRVAGEPLQYVLGRWSFRTLDLVVDRRVLIPRPETEVLVDAALAECDRLGATTAVDLGTGSGAIGLSLLVERPHLQVWATDASPDALAVAGANLAELGAASDRAHLVEGVWFEALPEALRGRIDVVVSNPPYVAEPEMAELPSEVRDWEPGEALVAGPEGLDALSVVVAGAPAWLARPGALLCEMAPHQARAVTAMAAAAGFTSISVWPDLAGRDRILHARL